MKITKLEAPKPVVAPFVPFTITVETPEEAAALCVVCGDSSPFMAAARAGEPQYAALFRFKLNYRDLCASAATSHVYKACREALK